MQKTISRRQIAGDAPELPSHVSPLLQRIYRARHVVSAQELINDLRVLGSYHDLLNIDRAAKLLADAIMQQQKLLIVGDYDADGATSSAVGVLALRAMGAKHVDFLVPNRFTYGYGLTPPIVDLAMQNKPDLLITVDNGIASHAGVARANELGIKVCVTDHHLAPETLPDAEVIVNPNQPGDKFASKNLAGVGVIFYVMCALRAELVARHWFAEQSLLVPNMASFLDIVSLGTVADVVPLDHNNRVLVHQGLRRIRAGQCRPGITALIKVAGRDPSRLVASDLGFAVGPRLNAAGRIDDMSIGIRCLLADDMAEAMRLATELHQLNVQRREIENDMQVDAMRTVQNWLGRGGDLPYAVCLYEPDWHQGVIGLVASRIKEKLHRPVFAFADDNDVTIKGSARSIKGLHIRDVLDAVATKHPGLIDKFGGHAMAAGLSLPKAKFDQFKAAVNVEVEAQADAKTLEGCIETDGELKRDDFCLATARQLREAGPWGQAFPEPMFDGVFELVDQRLVGEKHLKMTVRPVGEERLLDAIAFFVDLEQWPNYRTQQVQLVYRLDINEFRGVEKLQLLVEDIQVV